MMIDWNMVINLVGTVVPIVVAIITSSSATSAKQEAIREQIKLLLYRFDQLEKKVEKHNSIVERTYTTERDIKTAFTRYDELKDRVGRLEEWEHHEGEQK